MPRPYFSIDKIPAELTWVTETPDPNKCGCRNVRCCEETEHKPEDVGCRDKVLDVSVGVLLCAVPGVWLVRQ